MFIIFFLVFFGWIFLIPQIVDAPVIDKPDCVHRTVKIMFGTYQVYDGVVCGDDRKIIKDKKPSTTPA